MLKESEVHQQFMAWLNKAGVLFRHDRTDKRTTTKLGEPDFALYDRGRVLFIEVKVLGGKLRPEQKQRKEQLEAAGCRVCVCFSLQECVWAAAVWLGESSKMPLQGHPGKPLDCVGVDGRNGKGKADTR